MIAQTILSEVGLDMSRWPTEAHFASWLGLCPDNKITGGKIYHRGSRHRREPGGYGPPLGAAGLSHAQIRPGVHRQRDGILSAALSKPADQVAREESQRLGAYYHPRSSICRKVSF